MIDLSPLQIILIMFGFLMVVLLTGLPVAFSLGTIGAILLLLLWGPTFASSMLVAVGFEVTTWYTIIAIPLFIFMAMILMETGIVEELFRSIRLWLAPIPGGLAMGVVVVCVFVGAMSGIIATATLILGIMAVPLMLKFGYKKDLALGSVMAGGNLASLIPPSNPFIVYGAIASQSVGKLFMGGLIPGLLLAFVFCLYIGIRCFFNPSLGPPLPKKERVGWREKFVSFKALILPLGLIFAVLGSIFFGVASATEAAGVGAAGALMCAAIRHNLSWQMIKKVCFDTGKVTSMIVWLIIGAFVFKAVFIRGGGPQFVVDWVASLNVGALVIIGIMQVTFFGLGMFLGDNAIMLISLPPFLPIVDSLGMSRLWFGVLLLVNLQLASLTPPFGYALFYMKSVAPEGVTLLDIIRSIIPYIPLIIIVLLLVMFFPQIALWLPNQMFG